MKMIWWTTGPEWTVYQRASLLVIWYARGPRTEARPNAMRCVVSCCIVCTSISWSGPQCEPDGNGWNRERHGQSERQRRKAPQLAARCRQLLRFVFCEVYHSSCRARGLQFWSEIMIPITEQNLYVYYARIFAVDANFFLQCLIVFFSPLLLLLLHVPFRSQFISFKKHFYFLTIKNSNLYLRLIYCVLRFMVSRETANRHYWWTWKFD